MSEADAQRKLWNQEQKVFREVLFSGKQHDLAIELGLRQHAWLHTATISDPPIWSFEDAVFSGMTEAHLKHVPITGEHAIAWLIWHSARIEDVAMNMLVAGAPQVFSEGGWQARLGASATDTGNEMSVAEIRQLSAEIDITALRAYRLAVGRRTRAIICALTPETLLQPVDPERLQQVLEAGAVLPVASGLLDYWSRRTIAGLLLMPATRHNLVHLNEALRLKNKVRREVGRLG